MILPNKHTVVTIAFDWKPIPERDETWLYWVEWNNKVNEITVVICKMRKSVVLQFYDSDFIQKYFKHTMKLYFFHTNNFKVKKTHLSKIVSLFWFNLNGFHNFTLNLYWASFKTDLYIKSQTPLLTYCLIKPVRHRVCIVALQYAKRRK